MKKHQEAVKPFTISEQMMDEVASEVAQLSGNVQEPHDPAGAMFGAPRAPGRAIDIQDRGSAASRSQNNPTIDPIHPAHYKNHPSGVECIDIVEWMNFNLGNAIKYIWRAGDKGYQIEDLKKARWYLDREIERLQR